MPDAAERTLGMLGVTPQKASWTTLRTGQLAPGTTLGAISPLFPRIEHTVEELRKMAADTERWRRERPDTHTRRTCACTGGATTSTGRSR